MKKFKHSGAFGDLIYSLAVTKHLGGGDFYLHLNQIDWIGQHYYGSTPAPFHQGRMRQDDYDYMCDFMLAQDYINDFDILTDSTEITHNLDRFRPAFVGHPGNYVDIYANTFGIRDAAVQEQIRNKPWLTVPETVKIPNRPIVINRSQRWIPTQPGPAWSAMQEQFEDRAVFVGLPIEYQAFSQQLGWAIPHHPTNSMLEVAQVIAGAELFIGNQSQSLALAIGLGTEFRCEARTDLPLERNECYFPNHPKGSYF